MKTTEWLVVDTETDGLMDPIHVVEIAAQRMRGWEPVGDKFRVLLNHDVPIPSAAVAIHGYTQEFLRENGQDPLQAHASFREYAGNLPVVAHNLSFDWNRALYPEWGRLGLAPAGRRGFCSLMLSRRVVDETKSYRLDALRSAFNLSSNFAHRAFGDVDTVVALFGQVFRPRLEGAGISSFQQLVEFSCKTPVAKCLCAVREKALPRAESRRKSPAEAWYFIDAQEATHGPLPAREIVSLMGGVACWVWRQGLADWVSSEASAEFLEALRTPPPLPASITRRKQGKERSMADLLAVCQGILADGVVTTEEVICLSQWLEESVAIQEWPWTEIAETVERIMADLVVTEAEREELRALLQRVGGAEAKPKTSKGRPSRRRGAPTGEAKEEARPASTGVEIKVACDCGQHLLLDAAAGGQKFSCPACGRILRVPVVAADNSAPPVVEADSSALGRPTTKLELMCVGNAGAGYINAQIRVMWFEVLVDEAQKRVDVIEHYLPIKSHRREKRVNYCEYEVPEGVIGFYDRHVQTKPNLNERRFFRIDGGVFQELGEGAECDYCSRFLGDYASYDICSGRSREEVAENRERRAELDQLGPGVHILRDKGSVGVAIIASAAPETPVVPIEAQVEGQPFTLVQLTQGTPEWLEWRSGGIGASDAPAIMGENPWKSRTEILQQKCGWAGASESNAAMARGTELEPEARQAYISRTGKWVEPACLQSGTKEWLRASVDGISATLDALVEIKCGQSVYRKTAGSGRVPDYYYGQLQHILAITGLCSIDFWCYLPGLPGILVPVERDDRYIARLLKAEEQFWREVLTGERC